MLSSVYRNTRPLAGQLGIITGLSGGADLLSAMNHRPAYPCSRDTRGRWTVCRK